MRRALLLVPLIAACGPDLGQDLTTSAQTAHVAGPTNRRLPGQESRPELPRGACPDPNDPEVHYVGGSNQNPGICLAILFACEPGQELFSDECGCGCIGPESAVCPDPADPEVHYVAGSDQNPAVCATIRFTCEDGQQPFSDECGCGCIGPEPNECPDPSDPRVHYVADSDQNPNVCQVILFGCEPGQELFTNECGCGCIDPEPAECPDPNDPSVHYVGNSDQNPQICQVILFACEDNQEYFGSPECGCGCLDQP